jgi:hypothetical protein
MKNSQARRSVSRIWLISELNFQLKKAETRHEQCCGCRVRQLVPLRQAEGANWSAELFDGKCMDPCLEHAGEIIRRMQRICDVAW